MKIIALSVAAALGLAAAPAYAASCSEEIAMVTKLLSGGGGSAAGLVGGTSAVPSTGALSAVTGGSGAKAAAPTASPEALEAVEQAKQANAAGDETSCMDYIAKAKDLLGLVQ